MTSSIYQNNVIYIFCLVILSDIDNIIVDDFEVEYDKNVQFFKIITWNLNKIRILFMIIKLNWKCHDVTIPTMCISMVAFFF